MGVVVDSNTLSSVFNKKANDHKEFRPVLKWIVLGKAKLIVGGTDYFNELSKTPAYLRLIAELSKLRKIHYQNNDSVDRLVVEFRTIITCAQFNDPHIFALISASSCAVFCSNDGDSFRYLRDPRIRHLFPRIPKVYTNVCHKPNRSILCDKNLTRACDPHFTLTREQIRSLTFY